MKLNFVSMKMTIKNIGGLSSGELLIAIGKGAKIVRYPYIISLIVVTLERKSQGKLVLPGQSVTQKGFLYILLSALFGWWGIPFGPSKTLKSIRINLNGGRDVTQDVLSILEGKKMFKNYTIEKR